jgi:glycine oxidase
MPGSHPVVVIGGGVIGLSIAWRLVRRGKEVVLLERDRAAQAASRAAAGMLAASAEVGFEEPDLYDLCRNSLSEWPAYVDALESETGMDLDYRSFGTLVVADDRDAAEALRRGYRFQLEQGYPVNWLSGGDVLEREPMLSPRIVAAIHVPEDHAVDNRALLTALQHAVTKGGGIIREGVRATRMETDSAYPRIHAEDESSGEELTIEAEQVVVATGAWTPELEGWPDACKPHIRPVKGQILELRTRPPFDLRHVIRGPKAYVVPRTDGRLIVGATSEEMGFDDRRTVGGVYGLMDGAWEIVPGVLDQDLLAIDVGFRPAGKDNQPLIGFTSNPRIFLATGHYRHGIVLSVITALAAERMLVDGELDPRVAAFAPDRF